MQTSVMRQRVFRPASTAQRGARRPTITCAAPQQQPQHQRWEAPGLKQLAVGIAAAALLHSAPADAGVVLQKSSTKKLFQSEPVERVKAEASKVADKATGGGGGISLPKVNLPSGGGGGPTLSQLTLPLAISGIAVGALGWKQIDPGFNTFFDDALAKDNNKVGAGYEQIIKSGENMGRKAKSKTVKGTKKITKQAKKSPLGSLFGKK